VKKPLYYRMVEYDTALLPNRYLATLDRGSTTPEDWKRRTVYSVGYPAWGLLYHIVLYRLDPNDFNLVIETSADEDQRVNGALRYILRTHGGNLVNFPFCSWYTPGMAIWQKQPFEEMTLPAV
jgi:hypothetical protein